MATVGKSKAFPVSGSIAHGPIVEPAPSPTGITPAHFTAAELDMLRKVCRDSDYEDAGKILARGIKRADGR